MFEAETRATILERLKSYYDEAKGSDASAVEGTFSFDTLAANAKEFEKAYAEMDLMMDAAFPQTSWGQYLDKLAEELAGMSRREATQAIVVLTVTGTVGVTVPYKSTFATPSGTNFTTDATATIGDTGTVDVKATALTAGAGGNVAAGTITDIPMAIYGITQVTNKEAAYDGYEEETDADLLERLLFAIKQPATSGNSNDYYNWATSISGVGHVKILPVWNGPGTVKVLVSDANGNPASADLLNEVRTYIETVRPIGANVTVVAPALFELTIKLTVTSGTGDADYIATMLNKYFVSSSFASTISYAKVGQMILTDGNTGVSDYSDLLINDGTGNISVTDYQVPHVKEVVLQ